MTTGTYTAIRYEVDGPVAVITLNRPERLNALGGAMIAELRHAMATAERDTSVVGIVLTGAGRGFCAGADMDGLKDLAAAGSDAILTEAEETLTPGGADRDAAYEKSVTFVMAVRKPVVGAINGPAAGMGLSFAAACDVRFAAENAFFVNSFAQRGLSGEHATTWLLPRLMGHARALDMMWTGRRVSAQEAKACGLVNEVVPREELLETAKDYIRTLARTASPLSLMHIKQQTYRDLMRPLGPAMDDAEERTRASMTWPDFAEGGGGLPAASRSPIPGAGSLLAGRIGPGRAPGVAAPALPARRGRETRVW